MDEPEGGYLPFEFDVTQAAHPGLNTITMRVADPLADSKEVPHGKQSWYGPLSGLWQSVWIERRPGLHLGRLRVTPQVVETLVKLEAWLNQPAESPARLMFEVISAEGETAGTVEVIVAAGQNADAWRPPYKPGGHPRSNDGRPIGPSYSQPE